MNFMYCYLDLEQENIRYKTKQGCVFMYVLTSGVFRVPPDNNWGITVQRF